MEELKKYLEKLAKREESPDMEEFGFDYAYNSGYMDGYRDLAKYILNKITKIVEVDVQASLTENGWVTSVHKYLHGNIFDLPQKGIKQLFPGGQLANETETKKAYLITVD